MTQPAARLDQVEAEIADLRAALAGLAAASGVSAPAGQEEEVA
ncbi:MAG: hypothetical protein M0027_12680 [Candidatus Dormibacteraeota bacterium]|nr:hypothetical protein [Candidatus Dormibacteraeota bacterium]